MRVLLLVLAVLGVTSATSFNSKQVIAAFVSNDVSTRNALLEEALLAILESLRELLLTGNERISVMDPYERDYAQISGLSIGLPGSTFIGQDIEVTGLSTYRINQLSVTTSSIFFQRYRVSIDSTIPEMKFHFGNYNLNLRFFGSTYYGDGEAIFKVINSRFIGVLDISASLGAGIFLSISNCRITYRLDEFQVPLLTGFFGSDASSQYIAEWMTEAVPRVIEVYQDDIANFLSFFGRLYGNRFLADFDIADILARDFAY